MDRRSWPWKKRSSDKSSAEKAIATLDSSGVSLASSGSQDDKDKYRKPNYVQISVQSYTHLTGLEDQVKTYEEQVKTYEDRVKALGEQINELNKDLSAAHLEMTNKDGLVKQHAKVAEEAVSGWEKAEAEALALKNHLESVTLSKLTVEDRAAHLDGALKECMRQIRSLKEENEQKLQEVVVAKNKQCDKIKLELEAKLGDLDQGLLRAEAENSALSRTLQDRSNMLIKINEEKSQAEAEIHLLKSNIESCEREINSLKYELHIVSKELEIRNEEKNMSVKSAEVANKQHMEGVKKIAKLEAECQRLRGLVRKKLPGPAALAQMKLEVESLGQEFGETRLRRSPVKPPSPPHLSHTPFMLSVSELSLAGVQKFQKENEFLTERLLAMEEETKMLKEALAMRNSELQASRNICATTASKLQSLEGQLQILNHQKGSPKTAIQFPTKHLLSQNASISRSTTSISADGNDDTGSCADSLSSALVSDLSHMKIKNGDRSKKADNAKHLELMDDFLEMEKLAGLSNGSNEAISAVDSINIKGPETVNHDAESNVAMDLPLEKNCDLEPVVNPSGFEFLALKSEHDTDSAVSMLLQSRISKVFESVASDTDIGKILEEINCVMQEVHASLHPDSLNCAFDEKHCSAGTSVPIAFPEDTGFAVDKEISLPQNSKLGMQQEQIISQELICAVSQIHNFVLFLGKEAISVQGMADDEDGLSQKIEQFSASFNKVLSSETSLADFVLALSDVMAKVEDASINFLQYKVNEVEASSPDCIDKVALPENKTPQGERYSTGCSHVSDSFSNPEVPQEANIIAGFESASCKCSLEEFENYKAEKDDIEREFARCTEDLETTKSQLNDTEQLLAEVKAQLSSSQKMNSLADTQLKCMAESYKSLEKRAEELESEVNLLNAKVESLVKELQAENMSHQDALARCKELEEQLQRNEGCAVCSSLASDLDISSKQEKELTAAAEKLAECQETIFLLGKQLKALHPQTEFTGSPFSERSEKAEGLFEEEPTAGGMIEQDSSRADTETATSTNLQRADANSPMDIDRGPFSPSDTELNGLLRSPVSSNNPGHRPTKSVSSSASLTPTPEKHSRGFSRFFSPKGKNSH
ncbi:hypothetical protein Nepgr_005091 [Nepenthes gracilis]|uniref:Filament-like plant protein 4 n=1 Tax=Nepenthes gracilis TaxID=150966 RepID=A0AAD3XG36_NEPGR|nr:hypothetical protein Nepgr_005091 [Nepenthes gracilis]